LHTAAFHGAHKVLEFLCQSIHATDPSQDGGLANVNLKDTNGWTALHFAAGANSVETVQVLVQHGAALTMEANNGYTPLQWAQRLSNERVAKELRERMARAESPGWMRMTMSSQPLSMIANRFFSLIPTQ
jgi:ankyrin repeat protein